MALVVWGPAATPVSRVPQGGEDRCCKASAFRMIRPGELLDCGESARVTANAGTSRFDSDRRLCPPSVRQRARLKILPRPPTDDEVQLLDCRRHRQQKGDRATEHL